MGPKLKSIGVSLVGIKTEAKRMNFSFAISFLVARANRKTYQVKQFSS